MFEHLALEGVWLVVGLAVAAATGVFAWNYLSDKIKGIPSPLRAALTATETAAVAALKDAQANVVAEVTKTLAKPVAKPVLVGATGASGLAPVKTLPLAATGASGGAVAPAVVVAAVAVEPTKSA